MDARQAIRLRLLIIFLHTFNLMLFSRAQAASIVSNCKSYDGPGSLQAALAGGGSVTFTCSGIIIVPEIVIATNTSIDATGQSVTLSGSRMNRVLCVYSGIALNLTGLSIANGMASTSACTEDSGAGGGIFSAGSLTLTHSRHSRNSATSGGGSANESGMVAVTNSTLSGNSATSGGGIANQSGMVTLTNSTLSGNSATGAAGGIYSAGS